MGVSISSLASTQNGFIIKGSKLNTIQTLYQLSNKVHTLIPSNNFKYETSTGNITVILPTASIIPGATLGYTSTELIKNNNGTLIIPKNAILPQQIPPPTNPSSTNSSSTNSSSTNSSSTIQQKFNIGTFTKNITGFKITSLPGTDFANLTGLGAQFSDGSQIQFPASSQTVISRNPSIIPSSNRILVPNAPTEINVVVPLLNNGQPVASLTYQLINSSNYIDTNYMFSLPQPSPPVFNLGGAIQIPGGIQIISAPNTDFSNVTGFSEQFTDASQIIIPLPNINIASTNSIGAPTALNIVATPAFGESIGSLGYQLIGSSTYMSIGLSFAIPSVQEYSLIPIPSSVPILPPITNDLYISSISSSSLQSLNINGPNLLMIIGVSGILPNGTYIPFPFSWITISNYATNAQGANIGTTGLLLTIPPNIYPEDYGPMTLAYMLGGQAPAFQNTTLKFSLPYIGGSGFKIL